MYIFLIFLILLFSTVGATSVNITTNWFLRDPHEVSSENSYFRLGFFSPANSTNRYLGIWYNTGSDALEVVWVANKDNPLKDSSGVLRVSDNGDLQVLDGRSKVLWSSNSAHEQNTSNSGVARLSDTGNLVLLSGVNGRVIWQSFEHPTNSLLPQMSI